MRSYICICVSVRGGITLNLANLSLFCLPHTLYIPFHPSPPTPPTSSLGFAYMSCSLLLSPKAHPLKAAPRSHTDFYTHIRTCVICPVALKTAPALLAYDKLWYSRGWNRERQGGKFLFLKVLFLFLFWFLFAPLPSALRQLLELPPLGEVWYYRDQRPSVPDISPLCGRRSVKHTHNKKKKMKGGSMQI